MNSAKSRPITLGKLTVQQVVEMEIEMPFEQVVPGLEQRDFESLREWYWDDSLALDPSQAQCALSMHSFILNINEKTVLIDTCNGNHKERSIPFFHCLDTPWMSRLSEAGVRPNDVDMVILTHLHVDHVGWNTTFEDGRWRPTFPNARYIINEREFVNFGADTAEAADIEAFQDSIQPVVDAGLVDLVDDRAAIHGSVDNGIWLDPAFGHTPGSCTVRARREGAMAVFSGDVVHHPIQLIRPDLPMTFDDDGPRAAKTRIAMLDELAGSGAVVFPAHFTSGAAGLIERDGRSFQYKFIAR